VRRERRHVYGKEKELPMGRTVDARTDARPSQYLEFSAITIRKRSIALFLMRLPALIPWIFMFRGWVNLNAHDVLTNTEADVLGTGGVLCFYIAISITPLITLTGVQWIAPLRRWYGIWFAIIGISDATTAAITTDFAGGVFGRPMVGPAGIAPDRLKMLRAAFASALKDPELKAEAEKRGYEVGPVSGEEMEKLAKEVMAQPPAVLERMKRVLGN